MRLLSIYSSIPIIQNMLISEKWQNKEQSTNIETLHPGVAMVVTESHTVAESHHCVNDLFSEITAAI